MEQFAYPVLAIAAYFALQLWILPAFGIKT
jgi:hypothetical protein